MGRAAATWSDPEGRGAPGLAIPWPCLAARPAAAGSTAHGLGRKPGAGHVTLLGIGGIIGAGIFATVGTAAAGEAVRPGAGPSLTLSFVITAMVCALTALCCAEFAAMVPVAGSAYTGSCATLGEVVAWVIGWDLIIEFAVGNTAVAIRWADDFKSFLEGIVMAITVLLVRGIEEPARANAAMVVLELVILTFFGAVALSHVTPTR